MVIIGNRKLLQRLLGENVWVLALQLLQTLHCCHCLLLKIVPSNTLLLVMACIWLSLLVIACHGFFLKLFVKYFIARHCLLLTIVCQILYCLSLLVFYCLLLLVIASSSNDQSSFSHQFLKTSSQNNSWHSCWISSSGTEQ